MILKKLFDHQKMIAFFVFLFPLASFASRTSLASKTTQNSYVHQEADRLEYDDRQKIMHLYGHVKLWQGSSVLVCDHAIYYLTTEEAEAGGHLKMTNPQSILTGKELHVFYKKKLAVVNGNVKLVYTPKEKETPKKMISSAPITMTANELQYDWGRKIATAKGDVLMVQKGRKAWGDTAVFEEILEKLTLDGHVKLFRPPKDTLVCDHLVYELKTDNAVATGHVVATFWVRQKEETSPKPAKFSPAARLEGGKRVPTWLRA